MCPLSTQHCCQQSRPGSITLIFFLKITLAQDSDWKLPEVSYTHGCVTVLGKSLILLACSQPSPPQPWERSHHPCCFHHGLLIPCCRGLAHKSEHVCLSASTAEVAAALILEIQVLTSLFQLIRSAVFKWFACLAHLPALT